MRTADKLNGDRRAIVGLTVQHEIVTALLACIPGEADIILDIFQCAGNTTVAEGNIVLEIGYRFTKKIRACRNIGIDRQAY